MNKIQTGESMAINDPSEHMNSTLLACVTSNRSLFINDLEFIAVSRNGHVNDRHNSHNREEGSLGFPALRASTRMVVHDVSFDRDRDRVG